MGVCCLASIIKECILEMKETKDEFRKVLGKAR